MTRRQLLLIVLIAAAMVVVWLVVRAATGNQPGEATRPSAGVTATFPSEGTQRHTGTDEPTTNATDPVSGLPWIAESALPPEARHTLDLIAAGGPFPYPRNDNQTFQNREGLLPREPRGYYKEFTVDTPGSPDRGPRRIITGADGEKYWTADHYDSFERIREGS